MNPDFILGIVTQVQLWGDFGLDEGESKESGKEWTNLEGILKHDLIEIG